ncbi:MAG: SAM-dependent methyltransferase [Burkholderiaceae bacterium]|nr:SAM-dependent methyltransferase [Burkholderiaceae bacterium]
MHAEDDLQDAEQRFLALLGDSLAQGGFAQLRLSKHRGASPDLQRVTVREVQLKGQPVLSFLFKHQTRDITKNFPRDEGLAQVGALLWNDFQNAHLHTADQEIQLAYSRKGKASLRVGKASGTVAEVGAGHDKQKHRFLELSRPFLHELGVTNAQGELIPAMSRKWRQINKFVEVFSHALAASRLATEGAIHVADFGSGKGYLTFAMHDYLRHVLNREATVTGVELREDMVALCSGVIKRLGLQGMDYHQGDVRSYTPAALNVMIALHACDVATDYAIHLGLRAGADIIMCSPCCHKQLRPQMQSPGVLNGMLRHGIHLGQQAEMVTDSLRALLLDACGYDTQVFEFVALEHTSKNKMILAVKRATPGPNDEVVAQIRDIKDFYAVREQCLETLLRADGILPAIA